MKGFFLLTAYLEKEIDYMLPYDIYAELATHHKPMNVSDVVKLTGLSKQSVYGFIKRGALPALQFGTSIKLNPRDVGRWLESHQTAPV
jgi:excisionase family DNA binding protein